MKFRFDEEGRPDVENAIIELLDEAYRQIDQDMGTAFALDQAAAEFIWFLGQNEHKFYAPRLQGLYNEMVQDAGERADEQFGWVPGIVDRDLNDPLTGLPMD